MTHLAPRPPVASDPAIELGAALARLNAVLAAENERLAALDLGGATALLADKQAAVAALAEVRKQAPSPDPSSMPGLAPVLASLDGLAAENSRLLQRAMGAQRSLIETLARAALADPHPPAGYGAGGEVPGQRSAAVAALAFNRRA